jgi:hypothetical protein
MFILFVNRNYTENLEPSNTTDSATIKESTDSKTVKESTDSMTVKESTDSMTVKESSDIKPSDNIKQGANIIEDNSNYTTLTNSNDEKTSEDKIISSHVDLKSDKIQEANKSSIKNNYIDVFIGKTIGSIEKKIIENNPKLKNKRLSNDLTFYNKIKKFYEKDLVNIRSKLNEIDSFELINLIINEYEIKDSKVISAIQDKFRSKIIKIIGSYLFNASTLDKFNFRLKNFKI